jgi:hypothetical protein
VGALTPPVTIPLPRPVAPTFTLPPWAGAMGRLLGRFAGPASYFIPTPMGMSECEAPGVNFAMCMDRKYPRPSLPIMMPKDDTRCPPDEKDCGEIREQCRDRCWRILERPLPSPGSDLNTWDFHKCVNECLAEKGCL